MKKRKQIILTVKLTFVSERLFTDNLSYIQEQKIIMSDSAIIQKSEENKVFK